MRKTNRLLSLVLAIGMLLTMGATSVSAAGAISFSDVPSTHIYSNAITNLAAEGILNGFEDGTFKPDDPVTRAQFTKIICYAQNAGTLVYSPAERAKFPDVDPNHWAIDNITTARNSGIINGYDDGTFKPDNEVLYEQAVKMAVCALGYTEEHAKREGGAAGAYPYGYLNLANRAKLLNKLVGVKVGQPLSRGGVSQLIDNMLNAKTFDSSEGTIGGTMRDETSSRTTAEGRIVSIYRSSIYHDEESECNKKQVELELPNGDREFYGIEDLDIDVNDFLGRSVIVYYEIERGVDYYEAYNIALQTKKNREIVVSIDDIENFDGSELEYWDETGEDTDKIDVDSKIVVIHNGVAVDKDLEDVINEYKNQSGLITLLCSQDNDVADIAFVKTYKTIYVNSAKDTKNYKIYNYNNSAEYYVLDESDSSKTITIYKDGKLSKFSEIPFTCVASISISDDERIIDVQISTTSYAGTVTEVLSNDRIAIDKKPGESFGFTDSCKKTEKINAGDYVNLYMDIFGRIAHYTITSEVTHTYGYLSWAEAGTMTNPKVEVMIYKPGSYNSSPNGTRYMLKNPVKIDGKSYSIDKNSDAIMTLFRRIAEKASINPVIGGTTPESADFAQPLRFAVNSSNEIVSIITCESTGDIGTSMNLVSNVIEPVECKVTGSTLDKYTISSSQILLIPTDRAGGAYTTKSASYFKKGESYYVQFANIPSTNKPPVIYVYGTKSGGADATTEVLSESNKPMIVTRSSDVMYKDQIRKCLKLLGTNGEEIEVYDDGRKDTEAVLSVKEGDVVRVAADSEKFVDAIKVVAEAEKVLDGTLTEYITFDGTTDKQDSLDAPLRMVVGLAHNAVSNTVVMAPSFNYPTTKDIYTYTYSDKVKVFVVDTSKAGKDNMITTGTFYDIIGYSQNAENASKILVHTERGEVVSTIIFK